MRNKADAGFIKQLLQSPSWRVVEQVAEELKDQAKEQVGLRDTEWETIKSVAATEGRIQGINAFIQELYKIASDA